MTNSPRFKTNNMPIEFYVIRNTTSGEISKKHQFTPEKGLHHKNKS